MRDVELPQVLKVLEPIWKEKTETASRLRGRIESVLDWATARGYRSGRTRRAGRATGQAAAGAWEDREDRPPPRLALPADRRVHGPPAAGGGGRRPGAGIHDLTAARSGEVRGATWSEFELDGALWVVPAERMKAKKEHRVPLSERAVELLRAQLEISHSDFAFPAPKGGMLSDMTLTAVLRRMEVDAVPHGFRSTFRDWAAEQIDYSNEVAEMALAHAVGNKVEAAYWRGDLLEKRVQLMRDWAMFGGATTS